MSKFFTIMLCLFAGIGLIFAGTTGKIAGKVLDKQTGEPLAGANVVIQGSTMGAAVDLEGDFYIINIPPGNYDLEVTMIGYATTLVEGVVVSVDKTTPLTAELESTTLETEEIVVTAERPMIKQDVSHSETAATKEQMDAVPVIRSVTEYMSLQPGITLEGDEEGREMRIRGGSQDQIGMVVDGLVMTNNIEGGPVDIVNLSAIQEVSVIRGGFNAEYGNIRSGLFNVVTKEGSRQHKGSADVRYTFPRQKHRGPNMYDWESRWVRPYVDPAVCWVGTENGSWDAYTKQQYLPFTGWNNFVKLFNEDDDPDNDITPQEARDLYLWQHALKGSGDLGHPHEGNYGDEPDWLADFSLNGPIPLVGDVLGDMRYFISYRYNRTAYTYAAQLPAVTNNSWMAKLNFNIGSDMKVGLETIHGLTETAGGAAGEGSGRVQYYLHVTSPRDDYSRMYGLTFDHVISPSTYYNVRISYLNLETDQNRWRTERNTTILRSFGPYQVDEQPWGFLPNSGYVYALGDEHVLGGPGASEINLNKINTIDLKADLTSQIDKYNQVQAGVEFIFDDMDIYIASQESDPTGNFVNAWVEKPYRIQGYLQDKLEFQDFIANVGMRFDYNQPSATYYASDPWSKYFSRIYKYELETSGIGETAQTSFTVSPRLGVAHPITEKSKLFFNYGHFYDLAVSWDRFQIDYGLASTGITNLGNPNLKPRRTIAYELGYEHNFGDQWLLRVMGYYRDVTDQIGEITYENYDASVNYTTFTNDNFQDTRGFEIELRKEWGTWVTGWLNYTYMLTSNGFIGLQAYYQDPRRQAYEASRNPSDEFEKPLPQPYANGNIRVMSPRDWGPDWGGIHWFDRLSVNLLATWESGQYETFQFFEDEPVANNLQWKDRWTFDLRVSKYFDIGRVEFNLFLDIINVFDLKYLTGGGFSGGDDWRNYLLSLHLPQYGGGRFAGDPQYIEGDDQVGDYRSEDKPYINDPDYQRLAWNTPRSVILGIRIGF